MIAEGYNGTRLILREPGKRIYIPTDIWPTHAAGSTLFDWSECASGLWVAFLATFLIDGDAYVYPMEFFDTADDAEQFILQGNFFPGYDGASDAVGFWFNLYAVQFVFDKVRVSDFPDWLNEH